MLQSSFSFILEIDTQGLGKLPKNGEIWKNQLSKSGPYLVLTLRTPPYHPKSYNAYRLKIGKRFKQKGRGT